MINNLKTLGAVKYGSSLFNSYAASTNSDNNKIQNTIDESMPIVDIKATTPDVLGCIFKHKIVRVKRKILTIFG